MAAHDKRVIGGAARVNRIRARSSAPMASSQNPFQHTASLSVSPTSQAAAVSTRADRASNPRLAVTASAET
jgi:hypothetical protein